MSLEESLSSEAESEEEILRRKKLPGAYWKIEHRPKKKFITGSSYEGAWNAIGMHDSGKYNFFYQPMNEGCFFDNMFHGPGTLFYPNKSRIEGMWEFGHMTSHRYFYPDDLCFGPYCEMPDRSFILERRFGLKPAGRSLKVNSFNPREIPAGCYDTVDGFYDPKKKYVFHWNNPNHIIRIPTKAEHFWILKHCRKAWTEPVGFRPDLFENWYSEKRIRREKERERDKEREKDKEKRKEIREKIKKVPKTRFAPDVSQSTPVSMKLNFTI